MKKLFSIFSTFFLFLAINAQNITYIDLTHAKFEEVSSNRIFDEIEYIPLETHKDGLLNMRSTYYLTDKYIIGVNFLKGTYLFNRKTGAFIREVSSIGQGPNEYNGFIYNRSGFDENNNIIFSSDNVRGKSWKGINVETNKVELNIKLSLQKNDDEKYTATAPWLIKDDIYISFCNNHTGNDKVRLIVFDKNGNIIKKYPNYLEYINSNAFALPGNNGIFYRFNKRTFFKEWSYNDTIFCVDENNMSPHIIFKSGNKQPSYYHQMNADYNKEKYLINFVHESNSFVLFSFAYDTETNKSPYGEIVSKSSVHTGYYDKKSKQVFISSTPDYKKSGYTINGMPVRFYPISINGNNEMVAIINPEELVKNKELIDSKYQHLFRNIQEDDNPILIIAKLKK